MGMFSKFASSYVKERVSNTKTAFQLIIEDFKKYVFIMKYVFLGFSLLNLIYSLIAGVGVIFINIALLTMLVVYSVIDAVLKLKEYDSMPKKVRLYYAWAKIILNAAALATSLYTIYAATSQSEIKPFSIVLATLSIIMFVLKVLVEICLDIISSKWRLLKTAMILDAKEHPNTSGKIFSPLIGEILGDEELKESDLQRIENKKNIKEE